VNDPEQTMTWQVIRDDVPDRPWDYGGFTAVEDQSSGELAVGLTSLGFIRVSLRRRARLWCTMALLGLLLGAGFYVKFPPPHQATASVLLTENPSQDPTSEVLTDTALAQSDAVAASVIHELGLRETVTSFQASYLVVAETNQVLQFTVSASSSAAAMSRATALATAFLQYRATYGQTQQQQTVAELNQQVAQAQQHLNSLNRQIDTVSAELASPTQQAELAKLRQEQTTASATLYQVQQYATGTKATLQTTTTAMAEDSQVIDAAAPVHRSKLKGEVLYVAGGLFGGLGVGLAIVIIAALISDRLRRRDDIASAIGAPVRLSVGTLRPGRRLPGLPGRAARWDRDLRLVIAHLRRMVPERRGADPAGMAIVAVENTRIVAPTIVSLAVSCARQGKKVVVADLSDTSRVARLLRVKGPGVSAASRDGVNFTVVVPDRNDVAPIGPLVGGLSLADRGQADTAVAAACASADIVLTLATLDPAFGGDYLATWATNVVAVVTAGRSSVVRVNAVGEMVRLSGTRLTSVVLVDADSSDESLGMAQAPAEPALVSPVKKPAGG
jgi:capsular polysaccharide biosynthesis protein